MTPALRLLTGSIDDAEYRAILAAERSGYRIDIEPPSRRVRLARIAEGVAAFATYVLVLGALLGLVLLTAAATDGLPK